MSESYDPFRNLLHRAAVDIEREFDRLGDLLSGGRAYDGKVRLLAYAGYRNAHCVRLSGRIVRFKEALPAGEDMLSRLRAMMDIYNSRELPGITVRCQGYDSCVDAVSDDEGYFSVELPIARNLPDATQWETVTLTVPGREAQQPAIAVPILAPGAVNHWGVISDIDDTVVETGATNFVKNWRRVLIERPQDRLAVPGAATLYKMIARDHLAPIRPFFYVSSSPWNLYGFIAEFMELNGIPHGPMFMKDIGIDETKFIKAGHGAHKLQAIETILSFYPESRFLLIGDNGQKDVEIYANAAQAYPGRIGAVFIRDVSGTCREGAKAALLAKIQEAGIPTFCGDGFEEAVAVARTLDLERPIEAAKAVIDAA